MRKRKGNQGRIRKLGEGGHGIGKLHTPPTHPQHSYICKSIRISFRLGGLKSIKVAIPFWGGGREGVSEEVETLGEAPPPYYQGQSKTNDMTSRTPSPPGSCPELNEDLLSTGLFTARYSMVVERFEKHRYIILLCPLTLEFIIINYNNSHINVGHNNPRIIRIHCCNAEHYNFIFL